MQSILSEIAILRKGAPTVVDHQNRNRYRLVLKELDGSKTAYYFSTPIYNRENRKLVDVSFHPKDGEVFCAVGSNAILTVSKDIVMENEYGSCRIEWKHKPVRGSQKELRCENDIVFPTTNGMAMKCDVTISGKVSFVVEVSRPFLSVRANNKCFALMQDQFRPLVVCSCIGAVDPTGNLIAPAIMEYEKLTDNRYRLTVSAASRLAKCVLFEVNLYENKLFQDTTVESGNPSTNNAFGSVAFLGRTSAFGEQWLYSRLDCSKMPEMMDKRILKTVLHMPKLNRETVAVSACTVKARFCSFGSNWNNRVAVGAHVLDSASLDGYQSMDLTPLLVDPRTRTITASEGLIVKPKTKDIGFSAITTGDSYYAPQILEIHYR